MLFRSVVQQEFVEQLQHFISPTNLEDQILGRHRELKDGGESTYHELIVLNNMGEGEYQLATARTSSPWGNYSRSIMEAA